MNDKEKLKILAEAVINTYIDENCCGNCKQSCKHCDSEETVVKDKKGKIKETLPIEHKPNCPVLLAEEVSKEVPKDKGMLKYLKPIVDELRKKGAIFVPPVISGSEYTYPDGDCPHCKEGSIEPVKGTEPYSEDYLMCNKCDSTFNKDEVLKEHFKRIYALAQEYKEEFLHAISYEKYNLSSKAENPQFTEEWFNNIMIDCSICEYMTPHNYLLLINKMKEKGYIISSKPEEPIIIHNVMSYKGKNYLRQLGNCTDCSIYGIECHNDISIMQFGYKTKCVDTNTIWKSFDDIRITDELACMRKDIGDIYLYNIQENKIDKLTYVEDGRKSYVHTIGWRSTNDNMRLATAEEIQKHLEGKK